MYIFSTSLTKFIDSEKSEGLNAEFLEILDFIKEKYEYFSFQKLLAEKNIISIKDYKTEALEWLISYAHFILEDDVITETEHADFSFLKRIFEIKSGDFNKYKKFEVVEILKKQFIRIYSDKYVDDQEKLLSVSLQSLFNLSYDEFENIKKDEIITALINGANPKDLDIAKIPKGFNI